MFTSFRWSNVTVNDKVLNALLPGPVTLIFQRAPALPKDLNPGNDTIGIRIPNYKFMIELARYCNEPIALTSANISNLPSSLHINVSFSSFQGFKKNDKIFVNFERSLSLFGMS